MRALQGPLTGGRVHRPRKIAGHILGLGLVGAVVGAGVGLILVPPPGHIAVNVNGIYIILPDEGTLGCDVKHIEETEME